VFGKVLRGNMVLQAWAQDENELKFSYDLGPLVRSSLNLASFSVLLPTRVAE
jgi:hypothetical protein